MQQGRCASRCSRRKIVQKTVSGHQLSFWEFSAPDSGDAEPTVAGRPSGHVPRLVDLFCGCGGLSLGMEQAGFETVFASDIDGTAAETYLRNRTLDSSQVFVGDISVLNRDHSGYNDLVAGADLVCGGPPCQGFSMANRQRIIDDPRNGLYREYLLFLSRVRPAFFLMENVKGMRPRMPEILADMEEMLGPDYNIAYALLNASAYGVPQNRERLFVIGNRVGADSERVFEEIKASAANAPRYTLYDAISDLPVLEPNRIKNRNMLENDSIGYMQRPYVYERTRYYRFINGEREIDVLSNHKNRYNNDRDIEIFEKLPQGGNSLHPSIADIMPYGRRNTIFKDKYYKLKYDEVCKTITSHMRFDCNMYIHPTQPRGLSPREAARIQSFPDDYVFYGPQNSWYRQIGNAVPVKLAEAIGRQIIRYL